MGAVVRVKEGVLFTVIAPGGFRILSAIDRLAQASNTDLVITSACDGEHSGPNDPHHRGEAYDIRSHEFDDDYKKILLSQLTIYLGESFYIFLEDPGTDNEHFHVQLRKGISFP